MASDSPDIEPLCPRFADAESGDPSAASALFDALYSELHRIARRELRRLGQGAALNTTTLLHEAYLDMAARQSTFPDRARFMTYASRVMRGLIIDHVRRQQAQKRGSQFEITSSSVAAQNAVDERPLIQISQALDDLSSFDPALTQVVDLRFFCGFSIAEIAGLLNLSERTVQRQWEKARIYLYNSIRGGL